MVENENIEVWDRVEFSITDLGHHMDENWKSIGGIAARLADKLAPVTYSVPLQGSVAVALKDYAAREGKKPETIIAEALRSYLGDAA